jgi:hypothetical protein
MSAQVFVNGKEYDFAANRKPPRQPSAFEQGFDAAARGRPESDCPFPALSPEGASWQAGRRLYFRRRAQYQWFKWPDAGHPFKSTQSDITHLCLVINDIGLYSHMPCQFVAMFSWSNPNSHGGLWHPYQGYRYQKVVEWTHIEAANAMHNSAKQQPNHWFCPDPIDSQDLGLGV